MTEELFKLLDDWVTVKIAYAIRLAEGSGWSKEERMQVLNEIIDLEHHIKMRLEP